jgi:uncharacterized protein YndB with AHSA1/START domain
VSNTQAAIQPIHKTLVVDCAPERAFEVFTRELGTWWPLQTHSVGKDEIVAVVFEEWAEGRVYERHANGTEEDWGRVLDWNPPVSFTMSWSPGSDPAQATELTVRFAAEGDGTRVDLEHRGWEILAGRGREMRGNYDGGWDGVLDHYTRRLNG